MSHLVKALWDELWFVNMGYTNKIWLIDWLIDKVTNRHKDSGLAGHTWTWVKDLRVALSRRPISTENETHRRSVSWERTELAGHQTGHWSGSGSSGNSCCPELTSSWRRRPNSLLYTHTLVKTSSPLIPKFGGLCWLALFVQEPRVNTKFWPQDHFLNLWNPVRSHVLGLTGERFHVNGSSSCR